jgi:hypothetical protein
MPDSLRFLLIMMCLGVSRVWRDVVAFICAASAKGRGQAVATCDLQRLNQPVFRPARPV